jgi:hypothetical protein
MVNGLASLTQQIESLKLSEFIVSKYLMNERTLEDISRLNVPRKQVKWAELEASLADERVITRFMPMLKDQNPSIQLHPSNFFDIIDGLLINAPKKSINIHEDIEEYKFEEQIVTPTKCLEIKETDSLSFLDVIHLSLRLGNLESLTVHLNHVHSIRLDRANANEVIIDRFLT